MTFRIGQQDGPHPKCYFTHSVLPAFVDHDQPSQEKRPFSTIQDHPFNHTLDVILPKDFHEAFLRQLGGEGTLRYTKVYMKVGDVIEGDFFNDYIKTGNIMMLSEGRPGIDNIFSLRDGTLRLAVDKATYERMGLAGTAIASQGRKHVKARYAVEINLRLPSMVRGKHGFERIIWACKNVLERRLAWLFCDLQGCNDGSGPIAAHQPLTMEREPEVSALGKVNAPSFPDESWSDDHLTPAELLEWLTLTACGSPRVREGHQIDPYLSRYRNPGLRDKEGSNAQELMKVGWHGFIPPVFVQKVAIAAVKAAGNEWFAMKSHAFSGGCHTFLQHKRHTLTWEFEG